MLLGKPVWHQDGVNHFARGERSHRRPAPSSHPPPWTVRHPAFLRRRLVIFACSCLQASFSSASFPPRPSCSCPSSRSRSSTSACRSRGELFVTVYTRTCARIVLAARRAVAMLLRALELSLMLAIESNKGLVFSTAQRFSGFPFLIHQSPPFHLPAGCCPSSQSTLVWLTTSAGRALCASMPRRQSCSTSSSCE